MKQILAAVALFISLQNYAQIKFEKAYFIDNNNVKTECFIKNLDWKNNPSKFEFKNSEAENTVLSKDISQVKEFSIENSHKYIRHEVSIDTSGVNISQYSVNYKPEWALKKLFLKEIIQAEYSLYEYADGNMKRYFFTSKNAEIEQLVYKKYVTKNADIKENNDFRKQLYVKAKTDSIGMDRISKVHYNIKDLSQYFTEINNIDGKNSVIKNSYVKQSNNKVNFNIKVGLNSSSFSLLRESPSKSNPDVNFEDKNTLKLGFEVEYVFPFNRNKWAVYFEPTYQKYKSEIASDRVIGGLSYPDQWEISYSYLDLNIGLRHYMFVSPKSKIFINTSYIFSPAFNSSVDKLKSNGSGAYAFDIVPSSSFSLGAGYNYDKKYSIEFRYGTSNILDNYAFISSKFQTFSVVLGYTIFETNKK